MNSRYFFDFRVLWFLFFHSFSLARDLHNLFYVNARLEIQAHAYHRYPDDWLRWRFKRFQKLSDPEDFFGLKPGR